MCTCADGVRSCAWVLRVWAVSFVGCAKAATGAAMSMATMAARTLLRCFIWCLLLPVYDAAGDRSDSEIIAVRYVKIGRRFGFKNSL